MLDYQLLSPEEDVDEIYPYRRVWRPLAIELFLLLVICGGMFFAVSFGFIADTFALPLKVLLSMVPIGLFYVISVRREKNALQPREGLLRLLLLSLIVTNGVAVPMIDLIITPDAWLPEGGFFSRLIGYTLTLGVLSAGLQYAVVRYTIWPDNFRVRVDGIAYSVPVALGYATVTNLQYMIADEPDMGAAALRILVNVYYYMAIGAVMGYFLAEFAIGRVQIFWMALGLFIASFLGGIFFAFRRIAIVSGLGSRDIGALGLVLAFTFIVLFALSFLIENADQRTASRHGIRRIR